MIEIKFGPVKEQFGFQSFRSFLDHVDCYQHVKHVQHGTSVIKFSYGDSGIPVYDFFELINYDQLHFDTLNVIAVETLGQFLLIKNKLDKTKNYIVFSESHWDTQKYTVDLNYEFVYMPWDLIDCQNRLANRSNLYFHLFDLDLLTKYQPKYDFLCLTGRSKKWRDKFISKLETELDLKNSLTSYYGKCLGHSDLLKLDIHYERSNSKLEFEDKFYRPINVPGTNYKYNLSYFTKNELFHQTKFSLVVETEAELQEYHVTEKTMKCIVLGHPFVVVGTPYYLEFLHSLGFMTYSQLFNENYDSILDIDDRMNAVIKLVRELQTQTFCIKTLHEIQQHNINTLIRLRSQDTYEKFLGLFSV